MQAVARLVDAVKDSSVVARPINKHENGMSTVQESFNVWHALTGIHVNIYNEEKHRNGTDHESSDRSPSVLEVRGHIGTARISRQ